MIEGLLGFELRQRGHHWVPGRGLGVGDRSVAFHSPDSARRTAWRNDAIIAPTVSRSAPNKPSRIIRHDRAKSVPGNPVGERRDEERTMPLSKIIASKPPLIERPLCPKCSSLMWLARIMPDEAGYDLRTFECPECGLTAS